MAAVSPPRIFMLTALAMIAFAANSILARLALTSADIGPWSFTAIRFISGAICLALIVGPRGSLNRGSWKAAFALLLYGVFFSYAYISLAAGTGALILFAAVQITMIGGGLWAGERMRLLQWFGLTLAMSGLAYLMLPKLAPPSPIGATMMAIAGLGWGLYSLMGRGKGDPTALTAGNFLCAAILCALITVPLLLLLPETALAPKGIGLALASGILTSGLGYVIWYMALKHLTATRASIAQLTVPIIAATGGMLFIAEPFTLRFFIAMCLTVVGVGLATLAPNEKARIKDTGS
ncbi:DMT family transporter [Hellea balneolensis]|uniref:DMT family transporter n=1 Tax=Hellea balneolensis TaxID=287478 RepID=UPI00040168EC|nr:DMT family transporter [Hellea balneolensis]